MKTSKVLFDFVAFSVSLLIEFARNIVTMMTGNALFATPFVPLAQITTAVNDLELKFKAALNGGKQQKADLRISAKTLIALLRKQAAYIDSIACGSDSVILSSGYHITPQPASRLLPEFDLGHGENSGEVIARHKAAKGARAYIWQHAPDPLPNLDSGWSIAGYTTQSKFTDTELVSGSKHWYRVAWVTKTGLSSWGDPMMIIAL